MGCTRIDSPHADNGISIAAVFGVEWIFIAMGQLSNILNQLRLRWRRWTGPTVTCAICDEIIWQGEASYCSLGTHPYCTVCLARTVEGMLSGDLAMKYEPATTKPLCCFCPETLSTIHISSPSLTKRWDQRIITTQLQDIGFPLLRCVHCGYIVIDDEEKETPPLPPKKTPSLRQRLFSFISSSSTTEKARPRKFHCPQCDWETCLGCFSALRDESEDRPHRCTTDDLRLTIEKAVSDRLMYTCPRPSCGRAILKEGGCNHCTCVCGSEYCHLCHENLGDNGQRWRHHFCGHFIEDGSGMRNRTKNGKCTLCGKCPLYEDRNDEEIRRSIEEKVTREWKRKRMWKDVKGWFGF
ncbi:hypothetical protein WG66_014688 [Moniliophthora roreri]|nr:hypothetical protein WG66_014688 [Moniliophthora roreri]